jgi:tRNA threonylcarbamoyladenosine biosynthesis protein TsaB
VSSCAPLILAIEASQTVASVALLDSSGPPRELDLDPGQRSARALAPAVRTLLERSGRQPADVRLVAVSLGPGSFTSLRVGIVTAKTLAYALGVPVLGLGSLDVIAAQAPPARKLAVAIDAGRGQVYAARFDTAHDGPRARSPVALLDLHAWLAGLSTDELVSGPILRRPQLALPPGLSTTRPETWYPRAATLAELARLRHAAGQRDDLWRLAPLYVRPSAAEERQPRPDTS